MTSKAYRPNFDPAETAPADPSPGKHISRSNYIQSIPTEIFLNPAPEVPTTRGFDEDLEARLVLPRGTTPPSLSEAKYGVIRRNVALNVLAALYERDMQDDLATRDLAYQIDELD